MYKNRELHELLGLRWYEWDNTVGFTHIDNPDYAADPRLVLREMAKRADFKLFMDLDDDIPIEYVLDSTGKLRDMAIEYLKK